MHTLPFLKPGTAEDRVHCSTLPSEILAPCSAGSMLFFLAKLVAWGVSFLLQSKYELVPGQDLRGLSLTCPGWQSRVTPEPCMGGGTTGVLLWCPHPGTEEGCGEVEVCSGDHGGLEGAGPLFWISAPYRELNSSVPLHRTDPCSCMDADLSLEHRTQAASACGAAADKLWHSHLGVVWFSREEGSASHC